VPGRDENVESKALTHNLLESAEPMDLFAGPNTAEHKIGKVLRPAAD
jgi:hypothetical protein